MGRPLNVLVYCGQGTTAESVRHCLATLRQVLAPNYAVIPIAEQALLKEPWEPTCAALVFPGGADLGYCRALNGAGNQKIRDFVRFGGAYLGLCAGGYYGSQRCEFEVGNPELEVVGARELAFFPGTCRGGAFKGFAYNSERGATAALLHVPPEVWGSHDDFPGVFCCYHNGGGVFVDAEKMADQGVEILAEYLDPLDVSPGDVEVNAAAVYCQVEHGSAILTGPHPEFAAANLIRDAHGFDKVVVGYIDEHDDLRNEFLKACLSKLGLEVESETKSAPTLSEIHLTSLQPCDKEALLESLKDITTQHAERKYIVGEIDLFRLETPEASSTMTQEDIEVADHEEDVFVSDLQASQTKTSTGRGGTPDPTAEFNHITKRIVCHHTTLPGATHTPCFDHSLFYTSLEKIRLEDMRPASKWTGPGQWGNVFMYGEVVTSTNSLLDKNPKLLDKLPTGFTLAATTQLAGRGRGSNVWVAPAGSLMMSTVINHPATHAISHPIVFIQYIAAIAIVQAIKLYRPECKDLPVKLKWPNDIYARDPNNRDPDAYVKIGGILSTCSFSRGTYQIVLGIGINVNNQRPTTSLDALLALLPKNENQDQSRLDSFRIEELMARILVRIEALYNEFLATGFSRDMEQLYYQHWLHSGQVVTIEPNGSVQGRIIGITRDWGLLKVEELEGDVGPLNRRSTGVTWALQSDENSFDFWQGLIKRRI